MSDTRAPFVSWVDSYRAAPTEAPIDREAFRARAVQRAATSRYLNGEYQPGKGVLTKGQRAKRGYEKAVGANVRDEQAARAHRQTCAIERARTHLQRRGFIVFRADVVGGDRDRWMVSGRREPLNDAELLALAEARGFRAE